MKVDTLTLDMFEPRKPYNGTAPHVNQDTSITSARKIDNSVETDQMIVLSFIRGRKQYGATDDEIYSALGRERQNTWRARRRELDILKEIVCEGSKRNTIAGNPARVWVAKEYVS